MVLFISDLAPSCPIISIKKVQTIIVVTSLGKRMDYFELTVSPDPLSPLLDLVLNITFSYNVTVSDVSVRKSR
jgi:hypothetical protein